jgi:hypothetical protein
MKATKDPFMTMRLLGHTELSATERSNTPIWLMLVNL